MEEHEKAIQQTLDRIDSRIRDHLTEEALASAVNYSPCYFCRIFRRMMGISVTEYITRRKLRYALSDLARGEKIIDVAMNYGYETHAGFTKAFRRCFGYPPSLCCLHAAPGEPARATVAGAARQSIGGVRMFSAQIISKEPFTVVGYAGRHRLPEADRGGALHTGDLPVYWDQIQMEYADSLTTLHQVFSKSTHCEFAVCYDTDLEKCEFTYLLGVGVDNGEDHEQIPSGATRLDQPGGLFAVFTTPRVPETDYSKSIRETWNAILTEWLPGSAYVFDESRLDLERYDRRDHAWENGGYTQMEIWIPVRKKA